MHYNFLYNNGMHRNILESKNTGNTETISHQNHLLKIYSSIFKCCWLQHFPCCQASTKYFALFNSTDFLSHSRRLITQSSSGQDALMPLHSRHTSSKWYSDSNKNTENPSVAFRCFGLLPNTKGHSIQGVRLWYVTSCALCKTKQQLNMRCLQCQSLTCSALIPCTVLFGKRLVSSKSVFSSDIFVVQSTHQRMSQFMLADL